MIKEVIATGIIEPYWSNGKHIFNLMTKNISCSEFKTRYDYTYWYPYLYLQSNNRLVQSFIQE